MDTEGTSRGPWRSVTAPIQFQNGRQSWFFELEKPRDPDEGEGAGRNRGAGDRKHQVADQAGYK